MQPPDDFKLEGHPESRGGPRELENPEGETAPWIPGVFIPWERFQRLSLSQRADFEVHQSGNVDQKDHVKAPLFLFTKICPNLYMIRSN